MSIKKYGTKELAEDFGNLTFGIALESYRLSEEMTQKRLAELLKISPQSLCDLEKGRKIPSVSRASKIAEKLEQPIAYWVQLAIQDSIKKEHLNLKITVKNAA
jgi:transcriptional regulator with XRE-family HTH domain